LSQEWENVLAIPGTNSLTLTQTSVLFVPFIKENDKQLPAGSQKKTSVKDFPEVFLTRLRQSHLYIFFSMKELMHICGSHDVNHPEPGRRGPCHLRDLLTLIRLSALESVA